MKESYNTTLQYRHDIRSMLDDLKRFAESDKNEKLNAYLEEINDLAVPEYSTGNYVLDSVLLIKIRKMKTLGITFRSANLHYTGGLNIGELPLCSLLSNMLDNAIEALEARRECPGERFIHLEFMYFQGGLMILCENPLLGVPPRMVNTSFISSKVEPYHGLGISMMEKIAKDTGGHLEVLVKEDLFQVLALIPFAEDRDREARTDA